jgi:molybdate transport system ATP-binding protein
MRPRPRDLSTSPGDGVAAAVVVRLEAVTLRVGRRRLLAGTSWEIRAGQQWVLAGPNGAGKTSLAGALVGRVPVVAGRRRLGAGATSGLRTAMLTFDLLRREALRALNREEARTFTGHPADDFTVARFLEVSGGGTEGEGWARRLGLKHLLARPLAALSNGERRQVVILQALRQRPHLMVLDEPFEGLDAAAHGRIRALLDSLLETGTQVVLITHRREEIPPRMTHLIHLAGERVTYCGPLAAAPEEVFSGAAGQAPPCLPAGLPQGAGVSGDARPQELVRMEGVRVAFGAREILRDLNWRMRRGEHWGICGSNGAGKTTLLKLICGDHPQAYANRVHVFGQPRGSGESIWELKAPIGMVGPELQVAYRGATPCGDVILSSFFDSSGLYRHPTPAQREAARRWAMNFGVAHLMGQPFQTASSGEQRLVLIARAMVKVPTLLLLDEPCQGLDGANRARVLGAVEAIAARGLTGVVYVTHREDEWPACITHRLTLHDGRASVSVHKGHLGVQAGVLGPLKSST